MPAVYPRAILTRCYVRDCKLSPRDRDGTRVPGMRISRVSSLCEQHPSAGHARTPGIYCRGRDRGRAWRSARWRPTNSWRRRSVRRRGHTSSQAVTTFIPVRSCTCPIPATSAINGCSTIRRPIHRQGHCRLHEAADQMRSTRPRTGRRPAFGSSAPASAITQQLRRGAIAASRRGEFGYGVRLSLHFAHGAIGCRRRLRGVGQNVERRVFKIIHPLAGCVMLAFAALVAFRTWPRG